MMQEYRTRDSLGNLASLALRMRKKYFTFAGCGYMFISTKVQATILF